MKNSLCMVFVLLFLMLGCTGTGSNKPEMTVYTILPEWSEHKKVEKQNNSSALVIKMAPMRAVKALASNELLYSDKHYILNSYAYSRWNDRPAELLQTVFQISLEKSGLFQAVIPATSISKTDLLLESTLLDFSHYLKEDGTSEGVIRIRFYLIDDLSKSVVVTKAFISKVLAPSNDAGGAVSSLNKAITIVADELVAWLKEHRIQPISSEEEKTVY